jgi:two-component system sensor histidine kinase MprB
VTFRLKLALALACLSALAIGVCAVTAYAVTDDHLSSEIDLSLQQAAAEIAQAGPAAAGVPAAGPPPPTNSAPPAGSAPPPLARPPAGRPLGVLVLVVIQRIDASGQTVGQAGPVTLPVSATDKQIAAAGGAPALATSEVNGEPYRIETVSIPGGGAFELGRDLGENYTLLATLRWLFALVGLLITIVAAGSGWLVAGRITRRLARLTDTAENVTNTGRLQLGMAVDTTAGDEVGRLARSFATMVRALSLSREQQQALAENAEHELRTPLTSMRTNIDLLKRHADLPESDKQSVLADLDSELEELTSLVNELVELTSDRQDAGPTAPVQLAEAALRVAERMRSRTGRQIEVDAKEAVVDGRARDLERAMSNLLDNAAKFSPPGSPIELVVSAGTIEVRDRGIGVSEEDASHLFDRFYRAAGARSAPGSGLGLAIVRRVAEMHGGAVFARARDGGGSCIGFTLPAPEESAVNRSGIEKHPSPGSA